MIFFTDFFRRVDFGLDKDFRDSLKLEVSIAERGLTFPNFRQRLIGVNQIMKETETGK